MAGLALNGTMLGLRLVTGVPSLPEVAQDRLLEILPGRLVGYLIDHLQFSAKPLLLVGWVVGQTVAGVVLALPAGAVAWHRPARRQPLWLWLGGFVAGALFWGVAQLVALPLLGLGLLGSDVPRGAASASWSVVAYAVYGLALSGFWQLIRPAPPPHVARGRVVRHDRKRRQVIALLTAGGAAALAGTTLWRIVDLMGEHGTPVVATGSTAAALGADSGSPAPLPSASVSSTDGPELGASPVPAATPDVGPAMARATPSPSPSPAPAFEAPPGISLEITPNDQFYVVTKNLVDPTVSADGWSLEVAGLVNKPRRYSYAELLALPAADQFTTLECISNVVGGNLISNTRWTGVPLAYVLDEVEAQPEAAWVVFTSADNYKESLPLELARGPTTLLAHSMNGSPLSDKHGFPLRLLTTGLYGMKNPKWLHRVELVAAPITGTWERSGWNPNKGVETMARSDTRPDSVEAGSTVLLGGVAFAGDRGISRVEVSADDGATWADARLKPALGPFTWVLWSFRWHPEEPGGRTLQVRASDGQGMLQKGTRKLSYNTGATGYHTFHVEVV